MVAFGIQLDTLALVNRLSTDTALRQSQVQADKRSIKQASRGVPSDLKRSRPGLKSGERPEGSRGKAQKQPATPNPATAPNDSAVKEGKPLRKAQPNRRVRHEKQEDVAAQSQAESGKKSIHA